VNPGAWKRLLSVTKAESDPKFVEAHSTNTTQKAHLPRRPQYQAGLPCSAEKEAERSLLRRATKQERVQRLPRARVCDHAFANRDSFPSREKREPPPAKTGHQKTNPAKPDEKISTAGSHKPQLPRYKAGQQRIETSSQQRCDGNTGSQSEGKLKKKNTHYFLL
jgi:hypothetical protein